ARAEDIRALCGNGDRSFASDGTGSGWSKADHDYTTNVCETRRGRMLAALLPDENAETVTIQAEWNGKIYTKTISLH
ncbi:MAG: hypothetical protein J6C42_06185, partial [Clostridia bacterium]|nr:hypothetical protein [Clostridia bacterium]